MKFRKYWPVLTILLVGLYVCKAMFAPGFYKSHDGEFHLVRLVHFYNELKLGQFPVRFARELAYGYGYPVFNYFYPLMYYLGSGLMFLGVGATEVLKIVGGGALVGSGLVIYFWLKEKYGNGAALIAALVYMTAPYRLLSLYVIGSFGIVLAMLFVPVILWGIDLVNEKSRLGEIVIALGVFGLLLSHNVTALIFAIFFVFYVLLLKRDDLKKIVYGAVLGLFMAAFFVIPAVFELSYVGIGDKVAVSYQDHFPTLKQVFYSPWGYFYSNPGIADDGMSFQLGLGLWLTLGASLLLLRKKEARVWQGLFGLFLFLMLPVSLFVWKGFSFLAQIQFPWRILSVLVVVGSVLVAKISKKYLWIGVLVLLLNFVNVRNYLRPWEAVRYDLGHYMSEDRIWLGSTDISWELLKGEMKPLRFGPREGELVKEDIDNGAVLHKYDWPWWSVNGERENMEGLIYVSEVGEEIELGVVQTEVEKLSNLLSIMAIGYWAWVVLQLSKKKS